jgi:hypothetical protein
MVTSGFVLYFIPDPVMESQVMRGALIPNGVLAFYVWDYGRKMEMLNYFWGGELALDPGTLFLVEDFHYRICQTDNLRRLCLDASMHNIEIIGLEIPITFSSFDDYWTSIGEGIRTIYLQIITSTVVHGCGQDDNE